jgi:hypothetical protein
MKSRWNSFLKPEILAREERLAADKAAGLAPDDFAPGENPMPNLDWKDVVGENGQKKKITQCPVCATEGHDRYGNHLVIFPGGKFGCIRFETSKVETAKRTEHLAKVWKLAGGKFSGLVQPKPMDSAIKARREKMAAKVMALWSVAREKYRMTMEDWQATSADLPGNPRADFKHACSLYKIGQHSWNGHRFECSKTFPSHLWEPATQVEKAWDHVDYYGLDHTFGYTFKPGSISRGKDNRAGKVFDVVEHDEDGIEGQIALTRYLQASGLRLLLCVGTGNRGFHSWFDATSITPEQRENIAFMLEVIGADKSAFMRASTRTPGAMRQQQFDSKIRDWDGKPYNVRQSIIYLPKI